MDREVAKNIVSLVSNFDCMQALLIYAQQRIQYHYKQLETCQPTEVCFHQGAIREMRRISTLRDEVLEKVK